MDLESSVRIEIKDPESPDAHGDTDDAPAIPADASADALIRGAAAAAPHRLAFADPPNRDAFGIGPPRSLTWGDAENLVSGIAGKLASYGLEPGNVIAIQMPNTFEMPVLMAAAWRAGLTAVPLPMAWRLSEIHSALAQIDPAAIVTVAQFAGHNHADVAREAAAHHISVRHIFGLLGDPGDGISPIDDWFAGRESDAGVARREDGGARRGPAIMTWADSPAGPFPVPRTHAEMIAAGRVFVELLALNERDNVLSAYPFTGIASAAGNLVAALLARAPLFLHQPFDYSCFLDQLRDCGITYTAVPPAVIAELHEQGDLADCGDSLARIGCVRPMPLSPGGPSGLPDPGLPVFDIVNLSELAVMVRPHGPDSDPDELPLGKLRTGRAEPEGGTYLETRVRGSVTGDANKDGGRRLRGALFVRGRMVPSGPFGEAGALAQRLLKPDPHGYLDTGIACFVDEARAGLFRCERNPELIYHGGVAIGVAELDRIYSDFPGFLDAAAFAIRDRVMGERICAAIIPMPDTAPSLSDLRRFLHQKGLAPYKLPDQLVIVPSIPRDSHGRVLRDRILGRI